MKRSLFEPATRVTVRLIDGFTLYTGKFVAWSCLLMVLGMSSVVVLRYIFSESSIALQELATYFHALVFLIGAAFTLKANEHVRVDILYHRFSPRTQAWVNLLGYLCFMAPVCLFLLVVAWDYVALSWRVQEASREAGGLPGVYLLKSLLVVAPILLLIQGLAEALRSLRRIAGFDCAEVPHA